MLDENTQWQIIHYGYPDDLKDMLYFIWGNSYDGKFSDIRYRLRQPHTETPEWHIFEMMVYFDFIEPPAILWEKHGEVEAILRLKINRWAIWKSYCEWRKARPDHLKN